MILPSRVRARLRSALHPIGLPWGTLVPCAVAAGVALLVASGCTRGPDPQRATTGAEPDAETPAPTNRVDIPPAVRRNLGITFVTVEPRRVEQTLRVPGRFEYLPTARREYRTMLAGRVNLLVEQYDAVEKGQPLYRIDTPAWHELQQKLTDADAAIARHRTRLKSFEPLIAAHRNHESQLESVIAIRRERVGQLESVAAAGGGRAAQLNEARGRVASAEAELAEVLEKEADLEATRAVTESELAAARSRSRFLLETAASLLGTDVEALEALVESATGPVPFWRTITSIDVVADKAGVVESMGLTDGAWADERVPVLTVVQPDRLRFHAVGLQSDLGRLKDGLSARVVAPTPSRSTRGIDLGESMEGTLRIGLSGDPAERTIDLYVTPTTMATWARPGVSAQLEIVTDDSAARVLAVPRAAVQRDGLIPVIFRRDPKDPNRAIRVEADLGTDDGRWVAVRSGLRANDEVVLDGAFQLLLATSTQGGMPKGGHFHADGTFHADDEE